jgi:hypothetical protein
MADRYLDAVISEPADQVDCAVQLGGDRDGSQAVDRPFELIARDRRRRPQVRLGMGTTLGGRQERSLQVEPERLGTIGRCGRDPAAYAIRECDQRIERGSDRRRQERRDAPTQQRPSHPVQGGRIAHRVVPAPAMDMDIDEPRRDVRPGGVARPVDRDARDDATVDHQLPARDPILQHEPAGDRRAHRSDAAATSRSGPSTSNCTSSPYRSAT